MDYEKIHELSLELGRKLIQKNPGLREWVESKLPELRESIDEKIRKEIINYLDFAESHNLLRATDYEKKKEWLSYLEKQKEQKSARKDNDFVIYHPLKCNGEYECIPYSFCGSLTSFSENKDLVDFLRTCFYTEEECKEWIKKQKEPKDLSESDAYALLSKKGYVIIERDAYDELCDIEHIQQSWYMEGYKDCEHNREPMWIVKTSEDGPKYEPNLRYGQSLVKEQKPAEWSKSDERMRNQLIYDVEQHKKKCLISAKQNKATKAIYDGIEKCQDEKIVWLKSLRPQPQKLEDWTEEDERLLGDVLGCITLVQTYKACGDLKDFKMEYTGEELRSFVRSLKSRPRKQPHWKPSEEQMNYLCAAVDAAIRKHNESVSGYKPARVLKSLYEDLKKLM